jgi:hypothetical protein
VAAHQAEAGGPTVAAAHRPPVLVGGQLQPVGADGAAHQPRTREPAAGGQQVAPLAGVLAVDGPDANLADQLPDAAGHMARDVRLRIEDDGRCLGH